MARATKKTSGRRTPSRALAPIDVRGSAREIWLAGIGAMAVAEEESSKLFTTLVAKGSSYETKNRRRLDEVLASVGELRTSAMDTLAGAGSSLKRSAEQTVDRVESTVDAGIAAALQRLGVPTRREIQALTKKVERLTETLESTAGTRARGTRTKSTRRSATASA
ncbi:MAG: phasin family protein [Gemmatimonadaceae bacterium]|nr:phasin family protein [Gemmatimonadaceae bacterium]